MAAMKKTLAELGAMTMDQRTAWIQGLVAEHTCEPSEARESDTTCKLEDIKPGMSTAQLTAAAAAIQAALRGAAQ